MAENKAWRLVITASTRRTVMMVATLRHEMTAYEFRIDELVSNLFDLQMASRNESDNGMWFSIGHYAEQKKAIAAARAIVKNMN